MIAFILLSVFSTVLIACIILFFLWRERQLQTRNTFCVKYYTTNKDVQHLMKEIQTLITSIQSYGCSALEVVDYEKLLMKGINDKFPEKVSCEEVLDTEWMENDALTLVPSHVKKQLTKLIKKIVMLTCVDGHIDRKAFMRIVLELKNALCSPKNNL
jgi:hypothetical protein